jgi:uncharacterized protein
MSTDLIPHKSPGLLTGTANSKYAYAVNCYYPNSFRLLNCRQYEILQAINGTNDVSSIANALEIGSETVEKFLVLLSKTEIVSFNNRFDLPQKPATPTSLNFWIHTTNACNLGCSYCYISTLNTGKGMAEAVRQQLLFKLVQAVKTRGIKKVKLRLAGGEPMGQFHNWKGFIPEAKRVLAEEGCQLDFALISNLTVLDEEIIAFSKKHHINYGVSLDGIGTIHDATRSFRSGAGSFDIVDGNLRKLIANDITVAVNTVVTNLNLKGLPELTRYLISLNIPFRYSIVKGEVIDAELLDKYLSISYDIMENAISTGWQFSKRFQFCDLKPNELGFQTCSSGFSGGAIYIDGSFKYCHVHFGNETTQKRSIFDEDVDLINMITSGEHHEDVKSEDCKKCRFRAVCTSGCPVYRTNGKDPQCSLYHRFIPMYYHLQAKERLHLLEKCETL